MRTRPFKTVLCLILATSALTGCEIPSEESQAANREPDSISLAISRPEAQVSAGFRTATAQAAATDPSTRAAEGAILRGGYSVDEARGALQPQISGSLYAGMADGLDGDPGASARLSLSQVVYDGGEIQADIRENQLDQRIAYESYRDTLNTNLREAGDAWIALWLTQRVQTQTEERLGMIRPLFSQVERVAQMGIADRAVVTAARRQVNDILQSELDAKEAKRQAEANFRRYFGTLPGSASYNASFLNRYVPSRIDERSLLTSPEVVGGFLTYQRAIARRDLSEARDRASIDLEARIDEPLDNDTTGDSQVGLVLSKTLYDGGIRRARINQSATAVVEARDNLQNTYRNNGRRAATLLESIRANRPSLELAREDLKVNQEEVSVLGRQLAIGQSALDDVLEAQVRLYQAEVSILRQEAELGRLQLQLLALLGRLPDAFGIREENVLDRLESAGR